MKSKATITYQKAGFVGSITIDRPDNGNAINTQLSEELADICLSINQDETVRVVVITGAGEKHFCVGTDSTLLSSMAKEQRIELLSVTSSILSINQPVIGAINGDALGQGLEMALACDIRIAAETARLGLSQIASGFIPWDGGTQLLPRIVGKTKAAELIFTGETLDARQACEIGLVGKVLPAKELMPTVMEIAQAMSLKAPIALRHTKEAVHKGLDLTLEQGLRLEADLYLLLQTTEDRVEGIKAFLERRQPQFKGR